MSVEGQGLQQPPMYEEGHYSVGSCYHEVSTTPIRPYDENDENNIAARLLNQDIANTLVIEHYYQMPKLLEEIQRKIINIWNKHRSNYLNFWSSMNIEARSDYIMEVSPFLCYADNDRHYIRNGKKIYERITSSGQIETYDRLMLLAPYMTAIDLARDGTNSSGDAHNVIWLIDELCKWDLAEQTADLICKFRYIYDNKRDLNGKDYFTKAGDITVLISNLWSLHEIAKYSREKQIVLNDELVLNFPKHFGPHAAFGSPVKCQDPARILHGANLDGGTLAADGSRANLYKRGNIGLPYEYQEAIRAIHFVFINAGQWLAEYLEEYVFDIADNMNYKYRCNGCKVYDPNPSAKKRLCGACQSARYCSKDCQTNHWPRHKNHCTRAFSTTNGSR